MPRQRYHVKTRDIPPIAAARMLGLTLDKFSELLPQLIKRKFPPHDPTTGNYDKKAIKRWQNLRHPQLFPSEAPPLQPEGPTTTRERLKMSGLGR